MKKQVELEMPYDPKKTEDEWFARHEQEMIENLKRERERKQKQLEEEQHTEEATKLRDLHYMKCPKCGADMVEKEIEGIKIDECSRCEGIYFDRGELEQMFLKKAEVRKNFMRRLTGLFRS